MTVFESLAHLLGLFLPAVALAVLSSAAAKMVWRRELAGVRFRRLAMSSALACSFVALGGLIWFGHDGRMATYAAMVMACALSLWWRGFGPGR